MPIIFAILCLITNLIIRPNNEPEDAKQSE